MADQLDPADDAGREASLDPRALAEAATAGAGEPVDARSDIETLRERLCSAEDQAAENHDKFLRVRAEMDNYKKRIEPTYADLAKSSKRDLLQRLLAVKDNLERALEYGESSSGGDTILEGIRLTQYQLEQLLDQEGVRIIEARGKRFDPHQQEAVQSVTDPSMPDQTVVDVVRKGYTCGEEVLRPAQVVVSVDQEENRGQGGL